jgi:hypothetical protein
MRRNGEDTSAGRVFLEAPCNGGGCIEARGAAADVKEIVGVAGWAFEVKWDCFRGEVTQL